MSYEIDFGDICAWFPFLKYAPFVEHDHCPFLSCLPPPHTYTTWPFLAMANNQEEPFDYFQDDDFLFDDNVFDAIDKQESIYLSTQQPPDPVHVQEERPNEVPTIEVTYRDPPQRTTDTLPTTGYSLRADDTAGLQWQSGLGQVESSGLQEV